MIPFATTCFADPLAVERELKKSQEKFLVKLLKELSKTFNGKIQEKFLKNKRGSNF